MTRSSLILLKLGGSLITDKSTPNRHRPEVLADLAGQVARALRANPGIRLVIGHGSGSFAHGPAKKHNTRAGVHSPNDWTGFLEVAHAAAALNRIVVDALSEAGLPVINQPPSAAVTAADGRPVAWHLDPMRAALAAGLMPVVYGDAVFDLQRGGTILSTEDLFEYLATALKAERLLIAGIEAGVWADYPARQRVIPQITPANIDSYRQGITGSENVDATGGMLAKVESMLALAESLPGLQIQVFGMDTPDAVYRAILGESFGTLISGA